ncbi:MAG: FCD domain-containing protein, partial [Actinobacteria bacterium]|nr:FCD domain-containing protein [Actinomycetota bacterium]
MSLPPPDLRTARLRRNLDQVAAATTRRQAGTVARLNVLFHQDIVQASGNKTLVAMMAPLHSRMHWLFRMAAASTSDLAALGGNHAEIYEAIAGGHRATAERLTRRHVIEMRGDHNEPALDIGTLGQFVVGFDAGQSRHR